MAQFPQFNDSQNNLLAKIAANTGESQPRVGDGQHNLLFKIAQNTYASAVTSSSALQSSGDNYVLVQPGDDLAAKYAEAKAKSPSATNRITLFIVPGTYPLSSELEIDAEYVDLVGLGAQFQSPAVIVSNNTLNVTANDVRISGISVGAQTFKIANSKSLQVFENCSAGGEGSFGGANSIVSGTFINCKTTDSGSSINCFGGENSGVIGKFVNCIAVGNNSFGGNGSTVSAIFENCSARGSSFGFGGTASGLFKNCVAEGSSFGFGGSLTGQLLYCRLTDSGESYETPSGSGIIRFCLDGDNNIVNADAP
jgi:hypothetical protein